MDPSGGMFGVLFFVILIAIILLWCFAPFTWALGATIGLGVAFVAFVVWVLSNARFT